MNKMENIQNVYKKKPYKKLYKEYLSKIKLPASLGLYDSMDTFVSYLKMIRDYYIVTSSDKMTEGEACIINTIHSAVIEYEDYKTCINKYYKFENGKPVSISGEADTVTKYAKEKQEHWLNFWQFVVLNMEGWFETDESSVQ